jgi:hypothetical protein
LPGIAKKQLFVTVFLFKLTFLKTEKRRADRQREIVCESRSLMECMIILTGDMALLLNGVEPSGSATIMRVNLHTYKRAFHLESVFVFLVWFNLRDE